MTVCARLTLVTVVAAASASVGARAQLSPAPSGGRLDTAETRTDRGVALGRVVDGDTGHPVARATVTAAREGLASDSQTPERGVTVLTNSDGQFVLRDLSSGSYRISVTARGYVPGQLGRRTVEGPGRPLAVDARQRVLDAVVSMWKYAVITGTVFDDAGEPAVNVNVRAVRRTGTGLSVGDFARSDDRGVYRFHELTPGDYLIMAPSTISVLPISTSDALRGPVAGARALRDELASGESSGGFSSSTRSTRVGDLEIQESGGTFSNVLAARIGPNGAVIVAPTAFHPAARTARTATVVRAEAGREQAGVDVQIRTVVGRSVSGTVLGFTGPVPNLALRLYPIDVADFVPSASLASAATATDGSGRFTFLGVASGDFIIRALRLPPRPQEAPPTVTAMNRPDGSVVMMSVSGPEPTFAPATDLPTLSANVPVSVGDRDVTGVTITLAEGTRVSGQVVFDRATPAEIDSVRQFGVGLIPVGHSTTQLPLSVPVDTAGRFVTAQYPSGRYLVSVSGALSGWSLKSAVVAGIDAARHPVELKDVAVEGVIVTLTKELPSIGGTVRRSGTPGDPQATVVAFPSDYLRWIEDGMPARLTALTAATSDGSFTLSNLLPGEYRVAAIDAKVPVDVQREQTIRALAAVATHVQLPERGTTSIVLTVRESQ